jgi:predicted negative regulator of RcsB-dependent stress response
MIRNKKFVLAIVILFVVVFLVGFFWLQRTNKLLNEAEAIKEQVIQYDILIKSIEEENNRCQEFISQKEGDFGSFEYCKKFVDWVEKLQVE